MKILITGGAGFIGSHVADACIEAGNTVVIVDDLSTGEIENVNENAVFVPMDIRDETIDKLFDFHKFDIVIHHAAQMDVRKSVKDPSFDASVNILGTINLLENCKKFGVKKFIFASTGGAIYGEQDYFPADEKHPVRPLSPYGIAKLAVEKYLFYYNAVFGLQYVCLRYANVYGPRQNPHGEAGVVAIFTDKMLKGKQPIINGDGKQTRDYTFVNDVVRANMLALNYDKSDIFNVGTGVETDVNVLARYIKEFTGTKIEEIHGEAKKGEQLRSVLDNMKISTVLGWKPSVSVAEGLKTTVAYFRDKFSGN
ncbi:MAG: NAD-dependent epimerase/dehydratase family protein [Ignavibacteriales bacterium]|nr:NAD-dependent epimerase/dehydratase family protein [Ignavibacteriales bacterium]